MGGLHLPKYTETALGACKQLREHDGIAVKKLVKRTCELCSETAQVYCSADEAGLCFACDFKVHSANFLVSKHSRDVLCPSCGAISLLALTGPRIECRTQHCALCLHFTGRRYRDHDVAASELSPLSSLESCNSSCCTDDDREVLVSLSDPRLRRRGVSLLEEGCGDSEEHCPCPSKRKRAAALLSSKSHGQVARRNAGLIIIKTSLKPLSKLNELGLTN